MNQIIDIYHSLNGLSAAAMKYRAYSKSRNTVKNMKKTFKVTAAVIAVLFVFSLGAGIAEAQTSGVSAGVVTCNSATLQGFVTVSPSGTQTSVWFEWGTTTSFGNTTAQQSLSSSGSFSQTIMNLSPGTTYYYRVVASNTVTGTLYGNGYSFTTLSVCGITSGQDPTVSTNSATGVSPTTAILNGWVDPHGVGNTNVWFEWGMNSSAPLGNTTPSSNIGASPMTFSFTLGTLNQNTVYYYRAVAQNQFGTVYGQIYRLVPLSGGTTYGGTGTYGGGFAFDSGSGWGNMQFGSGGSGNVVYYPYGGCTGASCSPSGTSYAGTTWGNRPVVNTYSPNVSLNGAVLNGYVDPSGYTNVTRWFEWGTNAYVLTNLTNKSTQQYAGTFNETISGLVPNTVYYYRAAAQSSAGTTYGQVMSFTTGVGGGSSGVSVNTAAVSSGVPQTTAVTNLPSALGETSARLNGTAILTNNTAQTNGWFEWGETNSLGNTTATKTLGGSSYLYFNETLGGLAKGKTYYYRAVVQNQYGIFRGDTESFTTGAVAPAPAAAPSSMAAAAGLAGARQSLIAMTVESDSGQLCRGDFVSYTIDYSNTSMATLKNIILSVQLPTEVSYSDSSRGIFSKDDNTVTVDVGSLDRGETGRVVIKAEISGKITPGKTLVTSANVIYTTPTGIQGSGMSYVSQSPTCVSSNAAAALFSGDFLPGTLVGWLIMAAVILVLIIASRYLYGSYAEVKKAKEAAKTK